MRNKKFIYLYPSKLGFTYGNCATTAIASAFGLLYESTSIIARMLGMNPIEGLSFLECEKLIKTLCKYNFLDTKYKSNKYSKLILGQVCDILDNGVYIICFKEHLAYMKDGVIYDDYLDKEDISRIIPTGWWEIKY